METKKNKDKNLNALRMPLALTGFLFTGGLILASFSYVTPIDEELESTKYASTNEISYVADEQPDTPEEQPQPQQDEYVAPPQDDIIVDTVGATPPISTPPIQPPVHRPGPPTVVAPPPVIHDFPDVEAKFPGGQPELTKYIVSNIQYPEVSIDMEEQGRVYLSFVVEVDGSVSGVKVERGVSQDLDREAKRIVRAMPKWEAGEVDGKKVRTRCSLPIVFTLR